MVQILPQRDIFGEIGESVGGGFGKAASEQIKRNTLAEGLERLAKNKDLSEIDRYAGLVRLPGGAEHAGTLIPALQRAGEQRVREERARGGGIEEVAPLPIQPETVGTPKPIIKKPLEEVAPGRRAEGFATPEEIQARKGKLLREPTPQEIAQKELAISQQGITDPVRLRELALEDLKGPGVAIRKNEADYETRIKERIDDLLGANVQPGIRDRIREEGLHRIRAGESPDEVVGEMTPILHDIARAKTKLQQTAGEWFKTSGSKEKAYNEQKKVFDKYGLREEFLDLVKAEQGITYIQAAQDFDPLQNTETKKIISSLKRPPGVRDINYLKESDVNKILASLKPTDNLLAVAGELRDRHYSVTQFLDAARADPKFADPKFKEQQRQLQNPESNSMLGDYFWRAFK